MNQNAKNHQNSEGYKPVVIPSALKLINGYSKNQNLEVSENMQMEVGKMVDDMEEITGLTCIYVPVNDVYESIKWYQLNLGYQPADKDRVEPGMEMAVMNVPDRNGDLPSPGLRQTVPALYLHKSDEAGGRLGFSWSLDSGKPHAIACFITPRIEVLAERFKKNGVHILGERVTSGPNITFADPDGNLFEIWQP